MVTCVVLQLTLTSSPTHHFQKCTGDKKFICTSVKEALLSGAQSGICLDILHIMLPMVTEGH